MDSESVVRRYADMIYKIAYHYVQNGADAEDVFSEVWLIYFKKERTFESEDHRKAWLIRVAINTSKDVVSRRPCTEVLTDTIVAPEAKYTSDDKLALESALKKLRPEYREVIYLYYQLDLPVKTISAVLDRNENTVKIHLMRAREELRQAIGV